MVLTPILETHIFLDDKGSAWVKRAGVSVKQVVESLQQVEFQPQEVVRQFPYLMLLEVHAVLSYYYDHRTEIDDQMRRDHEFAEAMRAATPESPATKRPPLLETTNGCRVLGSCAKSPAPRHAPLPTNFPGRS